MKTQGFNPDYVLPGTRIGAYVIRTQIGYGGSSTVYEVESAEGNSFALKMCRHVAGPPGSAEWRMDRRQSRNIVCLENLRGVRNVAQIFAHDRFPDTLRGHQYLVQELVPGGLTITEWVKRGSPSLVQIVAALQQLAELCGELAYADIRHRDLKPTNILVTPDGIPKVVDFDSAICFRAEPLTREAASGQPGSHGYLCPELCLAILKEDRTGQKAAFEYLPWSDLHGLGVVFYEVLTGAHPFNLALHGYQMLEQIAHEEPVHPMRLNEAVPFGLNKVVMKLLVKNPLERYQHGDRVADDLRALLENVSDESWTKPFRWGDEELERPSHVTAPPPTPLPNPSGPEEVLPRPVLALPLSHPGLGEGPQSIQAEVERLQALPHAKAPPAGAAARALSGVKRARRALALAGALTLATLAVASWYVPRHAVPVPSSPPLQGPAVSLQRPPEETFAPAPQAPPPSGPLVGKPKREDGAAVAAGPAHRRKVVSPPSAPATGQHSVPTVVLGNKRTRVPLTVTAPPSGGRTDDAVHVDEGAYRAVHSALDDALKRERALREENERLKAENRSADHVLAAFLMNDDARDVSFMSVKKERLKDGGLDVEVELLSAPGKAATVITLTNGRSNAPWKFGEARVSRNLTSLTTVPFSFMSDRDEIGPGQTGKIAIVVDDKAFVSAKGFVDLAVQIFRDDGVEELLVNLDHALVQR